MHLPLTSSRIAAPHALSRSELLGAVSLPRPDESREDYKSRVLASLRLLAGRWQNRSPAPRLVPATILVDQVQPGRCY